MLITIHKKHCNISSAKVTTFPKIKDQVFNMLFVSGNWLKIEYDSVFCIEKVNASVQTSLQDKDSCHVID